MLTKMEQCGHRLQILYGRKLSINGRKLSQQNGATADTSNAYRQIGPCHGAVVYEMLTGHLISRSDDLHWSACLPDPWICNFILKSNLKLFKTYNRKP